MKKIITIVALFIFSVTQAQEAKQVFEKSGDIVKATYFNDKGDIVEQGFFEKGKLSGTWCTFDSNGKKTVIANYVKGKKEGKWIFVVQDGLKEVTYKNNRIENVSSSTVALK